MTDELTKEEKSVLRKVANEEKTKVLRSDNLYFFKPALHIDTQKARIYTSVPLPVAKMVKGQPVLDTQTMVVSRNDTFILDEEQLESKGLFPLNMPILPFPTRWELSDINDFIGSVESVESEHRERIEKYNICTFSTIKDMFDYFMDFSYSEEYGLFSLWIMMGYIFPIFNEVPFINLSGFKNSGKSKVISIFSQLCFNAESTMNISPAALYHSVEQNMSVILIDEGEKLTGIEKEPDLRLLLNACYKKGGSVARWNPDTKKIERNYVFTPAAIGAINPLEPTLLSRCINRNLLKTTNLEKGKRKVTERTYPWQEVRNRLYRFMFTAAEEIEEIYLTEDFGTLNCRNLEKWQPLLSIAKYLNNHGEEKIYEEIRKLAEEEQEDESALTETEEITLHAINAVVSIGGEYFIKEIKAKMKAFLEEEGNAKAIEYLNNKTIASILKKFGFRSGKRKNTGIPYRINREQIEKLYKRYALPLTPSTLSTLPTPTEAKDISENVGEEQKREKWTDPPTLL